MAFYYGTPAYGPGPGFATGPPGATGYFPASFDPQQVQYASMPGMVQMSQMAYALPVQQRDAMQGAYAFAQVRSGPGDLVFACTSSACFRRALAAHLACDLRLCEPLSKIFDLLRFLICFACLTNAPVLVLTCVCVRGSGH